MRSTVKIFPMNNYKRHGVEQPYMQFSKMVSRKNSSIIDGITFCGGAHAQQGFRT